MMKSLTSFCSCTSQYWHLKLGENYFLFSGSRESLPYFVAAQASTGI